MSSISKQSNIDSDTPIRLWSTRGFENIGRERSIPLIENPSVGARLRGPYFMTQIYTNPDIYRNAISMFSTEEMRLIDDYRRNGESLNQRWRTKEETTDDREFSKKLNQSFRTVQTLFGDTRVGGLDYITACRHMTFPIGTENLRGFISTSNMCLPEFGRYRYYIKIPKDASVGIIELKQLDMNGNTIPDLFEIILPQNTSFHKSSDGYYVVRTPHSMGNPSGFNILDKKKTLKLEEN